MADTPKKIVQSVNLCFICSKKVDKKENKIRIFGTRSADLVETIRLALEVDLKCYSGNTDLFICKANCYSRITRFKHSLDKMNALKKELRTVFSSKTAGSRFKRMLRADISPCKDAVEVNSFGANTETEQTSSKKRIVQRLEFCDIQNTENSRPLEVTTRDSCTTLEPAARVGRIILPKLCQQNVSIGNFATGSIYPKQRLNVLCQAFPCQTGGFLSQDYRSPVTTQAFQQTLSTILTAPDSKFEELINNPITSTPLSSHRAQYNGEKKVNYPSISGDYVKVTVRYPSKEVNKILSQCYLPLGKALADGSPSRIAKAIMNCEQLRKSVIEKVLNVVSLETTNLCSRNRPSLLKKTTKEDLINFDLCCICKEWKEKAPVFYSFLLACCESNRKIAAASWFGSVAIAGSILLKQRDPAMSATGIVMGILLKTRSIEVRLFNNHAFD